MAWRFLAYKSSTQEVKADLKSGAILGYVVKSSLYYTVKSCFTKLKEKRKKELEGGWRKKGKKGFKIM